MLKRMKAWATCAGVLAGAALLVGLCCGCGSYVKRGTTLYSEGRYVEAAEVFEQSEYRLQDSSSRQRAEYGLYRGLTLLVLGDLNNAQRWFKYAYEIERVSPGTLPDSQRALLDRGWFEVGQRLRNMPPPPVKPPGTAVAASQLPQRVSAPEGAPEAAPTNTRSLVGP